MGDEGSKCQLSDTIEKLTIRQGQVSPELPRTIQAIFGEWLPNSEFELDGADFEYYDDEFDPQSGTGRFYIYVPIKRKETV